MRDQAGLQAQIEPDGRDGNQNQLSVNPQGGHQEHQGKRDGHKDGTKLRDFPGTQFIRQAARQRGCQRTGCPCDTKTTGDGTPEVIAFQQHDRKRRPEGAKGYRQKTLGQRGTAQSGIATPQMFHRAQQCGIAQRGVNGETREYGPHHHADKRNTSRSQLIHHAPAKRFAYHAADGSGEQNAQQQTGHHRTHGFPLFAFRRKDRRSRDNILRHGGGHADEQACQQQGVDLSGQATAQQEQRQGRALYQD